MSSYPVLNNRPIDQWRVTDLKDELRKRRLPVKGLKEELVRRLFDSIQSEKANEVAEDVDVNAAGDQLPEKQNVAPGGIPIPDENVSQKTTVTITEVRQETVFHVTQQAEVPSIEVGQESTVLAAEEAPGVDIEASLTETTAGKGEEQESVAAENPTVQEVQPHTESNVGAILEKASEVGTGETVIASDVIGTDVKSDVTSSEAKPDGTEVSNLEKQVSAPAPANAFASDADPMDTDVSAAPENNDEERLTPKNDLADNASMYDEELKDSKLTNEDSESIVSKPNNQN